MVGPGRFELPTFAPPVRRANQAALRPDLSLLTLQPKISQSIIFRSPYYDGGVIVRLIEFSDVFSCLFVK